MTKGLTMRLIPALMMMGFAGMAGAAGFAVQNQAGSGNGNAFAGAAAVAEDAGTVYFNPAGMVYLPEGHNISLAGTLLSRTIDYKDIGTTTGAVPAAIAFAIPGTTIYQPTGNGGNAGGLALIPAGYWAYSISPALRVGLGISPTFGNETEYDKNFRGFNSGFYASMKQINVNPSVAYKINERFSLGGGVNFAKNSTEFKFGFPFTHPLALVGLPAGAYTTVKVDDWAVGYNLGVMLQPSPSTRIGLTYRSAMSFNLKGDQKFTVQNATMTALGQANRDVEAKVRMPASASLAVFQKLSDRWEMLGDFTWTGWSSIDNVYLKQESNGALIKTLAYNFKDTYRIGLGANYQYNDNWKLRFGIAYDKSPVKHASDRTMTLPDSDRFWVALGGKYAFSKTASLDFSYAHIFFREARSATPVTAAGSVIQTIRGEWDNSADLLSVQYNHTF